MEKLKSILKQNVVLIVLILFTIIATLASDKFFTVMNITNVLRQVSMTVIVGGAATLLMVSGGLDLSVGSSMALSAIVLAELVGRGRVFPLVLAIIIAILTGVLCGIINGFLIVNLNVSPIIATLGTLYVYRGAVFVICKSQVIGTGFPPGYTLLGQGYVGKIPIPVIIFIFIVSIFIIIQKRTLLGRYSYVIGGGEQVARLYGVPVKKYKFIMYLLTGLMCGVAGVILTSRTGSAGPNFAIGFEFDVIVAILIGGTVLGGGRGTVLGMLFGALILGILNNGLNLIGVTSAVRQISIGVVFVLAIIMHKLIKGEKVLELF